VVLALVSGLLSVLLAAPAGASPAPEAGRRTAETEITRVVVISVDGLNPDAITQLGEAGARNYHRLMSEGAWTFNARTEVEQTVTLPNHTGMLTSRRVDKTRGGHGVTWDDDRLVPRTVQAAAGHPVASVFSALKAAGLDSAMFAAKTKFSLYQRSWPGMGRAVIDLDNARLVRTTRADLSGTWRAFTFLHLSLPDLAGHRYGWLSPEYLTAVRQSDTLIGRVLKTVTSTTDSLDHTMVVVTADHGGRGKGHADRMLLADYRIPFLVWGPGVPGDTDLYDLNPTYADPGTQRVGYAAAGQPVRNGDVGNLVLDVLVLPARHGSELDAAQDLEVTQP
jgi:predicted AlkP superfamily pyrophosphatase or phosphodiesterase